MEFFDCVPLPDALALLNVHMSGMRVGCEIVELGDSLGRVTAENFYSQEPLPGFSRSSVDGYAVRSADTFGANEAVPALFTVVGEVLMGRAAESGVGPGEATIIPTGGMLPAGADAIVMLEYTEQLDIHTVMVSKAVAPGENVVWRGEDYEQGSLILGEGQPIGPQQVGVLAAFGVTHVKVRKKPRVAIISTGDEVVDIRNAPAPGQVRDINTYTLAAMLSQEGCETTRLGIVKDSYQDFLAALETAIQEFDIIVVSGGSSVGARDFTVRAIGVLGEPGILMHGVAIKPGKPTIFGMVAGKPVFGLPGHPVAAMTVCEQLVKPAVRLSKGQVVTRERMGVMAKMTRNVASVPGRDDFINVRLVRHEGEFTAEPLLGKSGLVSLMARADGMVHIAAEKGGLYTGDVVEVILYQARE